MKNEWEKITWYAIYGPLNYYIVLYNEIGGLLVHISADDIKLNSTLNIEYIEYIEYISFDFLNSQFTIHTIHTTSQSLIVSSNFNRRKKTPLPLTGLLLIQYWRFVSVAEQLKIKSKTHRSNRKKDGTNS